MSNLVVEERKDQCLSEPIYHELLKQEIKKNKNAGIYIKSRYYVKLGKGQELSQRLYGVQRRKDIIKDGYNLLLDCRESLTDRNIIKSLSERVQDLRKLRIRLDQFLKPAMMTNWTRILQGINLPKLKTLTLYPCNPKIPEIREGQFPLFRSRPPNVESLTIVCNQTHGIENIPMKDVTLRLMRGIRKLKRLCFDVYSCVFMKDEHLDIIGKALQSRLYHLKSLRLRFDALSNKITAKGVASLWKSLDKIPNLKKLELTGSYSRGRHGYSVIDYETFVVLCDVLQRKSATLKTLKLDFGSSELGYDDHKYLCKSIVDLLPRLHQLQWKFNGGEPYCEDSLPLLGDLLGNGSDSLEILSLDFRCCSWVTPKGAQEFADKMKKGSFPAVDRLSLFFHFMPKLRFEGLYCIAEAISTAFPNLEDLTFGSKLDPFGDNKDSLHDSEIKTKAEILLKEKLPNLTKDFSLSWDN